MIRTEERPHQLGVRAAARVDYVAPVLLARAGQLLEALDEEDARVADLARPLLVQVEASHKHRLVLLAVGEAGAKK